MKLLEYEAKALLQKTDVPVPQSFLAGEHPEFLPAVMKSQVPVGGRGKAGGIIVVDSDVSYQEAADRIVKLEIKGFLPKKVLAEEVLDIKKELYLSLLVDKAAAQIMIMANVNGGVEVEDNAEDSFWKQPITRKDDADQLGESLAEYYNLPELTFALQDLIEKLYSCFTANDALLLEINPLVITSDDHIVAGDCKMELDDAATWRHDDWQFEAEKTETNFVTLDPEGIVATVANGAGLAMATVDAAADAGLTPANFLDVGGGSNEASMLAAFRRLMEYPNVKVIIINIFAGISRCDEVARAIIAARDQIADLPPLAIRLAGTNYDEAVKLLTEEGIAIEPSLASAIDAAKKAVGEAA